ncbi:RNA pseudouridine synthase family protein [Nitzschia inconspicua]|uniref:RNA pseudouridine synthase family protein n=1 Tax=Nitzschia inconspicua TaxID=303405 RepID=A0A9K3PRG7_9STRA|nr:RNA pseudouridine synthase family protein [Nitzschia inconspicua]
MVNSFDRTTILSNSVKQQLITGRSNTSASNAENLMFYLSCLFLVLSGYNGWVGYRSQPTLSASAENRLRSTNPNFQDSAYPSSSSSPTTVHRHRRARIPILSYHNDWVCINKPPGITVHRSKDTPRHERVLTTSVKRQLGRKVFPVHRLDHRTSGALLLSFDSKTAGVLHDCAIRRGAKQYIALLRGEWTYPETTRLVDLPLCVENVSKEARTKFTLLATTNVETEDNDNDGRCSLVLCEPLTGRTHQIRRHAREINHPIIGDSQHGDSRINRYWREQRSLGRLALHCWTLDFALERNCKELEEHHIVAPLPDDMRKPLEMFVPHIWKTATNMQPELLMDVYDERGGSHGRHYRNKRTSSTTILDEMA